MGKFKKLKIFGVCIMFSCILLVSVNSSTVYPFIYLFKGIVSIVDKQGAEGVWKEQIEKVYELGTESIVVSGYPDAKVYLYGPEKINHNLPLIIYIHGGGWSTGTASSVEWYAKLLASNGYIVANVDYSLAPEYAYPASTYQLIEMVNHLYENVGNYGYNPKNIFIGGNSAGAHLSSQLGALISNSDYAKKVGVSVRVPVESIKGILLYNGVYNFETVGECKFPFFDELAWAYVGEKNYENYDRIDELSTVKYITKDYPPVFITVGDVDPLQSQTMEFIQKLEENDVYLKKMLWENTNAGLWHDYIYEQDKEEAQKAYRETVMFVNEEFSYCSKK